MRKRLIAFVLFILVGLILLFDHTSALLMSPLSTPSSFLQSMPYVMITIFDFEV